MNILFLAFIPLILIPFLALIFFNPLVTTYTSVGYKAECKNALHIIIHNSISRKIETLLEPIPALASPIFDSARLLQMSTECYEMQFYIKIYL